MARPIPAVLPLIRASFPSNSRFMAISFGLDEESRQTNDHEKRTAFR
jgi:hypothetical protein